MRIGLVMTRNTLIARALILALTLISICAVAADSDPNEEYQLLQLQERFSQAFVFMQDKKFQDHRAYQIVVEYPILAINYLASKNTLKSREALVSMAMFRLDGALAEDHSCAVLSLRSSVKAAITRHQSKDLRATCLSLASKLSLPVDALCAADDVTKRRLEMLMKGVNSHRTCSN